jgi:hypothetical protein
MRKVHRRLPDAEITTALAKDEVFSFYNQDTEVRSLEEERSHSFGEQGSNWHRWYCRRGHGHSMMVESTGELLLVEVET